MVMTSQMTQHLYEEYKDTEIIFTKEIIHTLKMDPRQIYIKSGGSQWPCIINSTSFSSAKVIVGTSSDAYAQLSKRDAPQVSLRFSFYQADGQTMSFFVNCKVKEVNPYMSNKDLAIINFTYTQRPPEDLIQMVGHLLDANANSIKRKEDRILITQDSLRKLGLQKKETVIIVQNVPRHAILQDISFGGCKVILLGLAQFLINKEAILQLEFDDPHETITLKGTIIGTTFIKDRKDIVAANIKFNEDSITLGYKVHINNYLQQSEKKI